MEYFKVGIRYDRINEQNGQEETVTEQRLFDAVTFGEAENMATHLAELITSGEFSLPAIVRTNLDHVENGDNDFFWQVELKTKVLNEQTGRENISYLYVLLSVETAEQAMEKALELFSDSIYGVKVSGVNETKIIELIDKEILLNMVKDRNEQIDESHSKSAV